jgi:hypothetical protein
MANDNDDSFLDLSYMDENNLEANGKPGIQTEQEDTVDFYDDDFDPSATAGQSLPDAPVSGTSNGDVKSEPVSDQTAVPSAEQNVDQTLSQDTSSSKKRKERDDDEYSQTQPQSTHQTPRPSSTTPMPPTQSYGQPATQALDIKQLPHEITEDSIREWANAVGRENEILELKFDEFKPNGKSKG